MMVVMGTLKRGGGGAALRALDAPQLREVRILFGLGPSTVVGR